MLCHALTAAGWRMASPAVTTPSTSICSTKRRTYSSAGLARKSAAVPCWTTRPSFISTMRPPSAMASSRSWLTKTMVFFSRLCSATSSCCMSRRISGSRALKASSIKQHVRIERQRAGEAGALLHAAGELRGIMLVPALQPDRLDGGERLVAPPVRRHALDFQAVFDVLQDGAVGEQRELLEHHAEAGAAQLHQVALGQRGDVGIVDEDAAGGRLDQPVDAAQAGRLARARQAHDDEDLALVDIEADILQADHRAGGLEDVGPVLSGLEQRQRRPGLVAEDLG